MIVIPRFRIKPRPEMKDFIMEDQLNTGPKYMMNRRDLVEFMQHIAFVLAMYDVQKELKKEESKTGGE